MTRTVKGPTDHVVVVGAGLGGLSAALRLAGAGRKVTVIERESVPGGRNGLLNKDGYSFDTGPTVLTMPSLIQDAFSCVGEDMKDWLELMPLSPLYRAFYADGSQIDVHANTAQMEEEIRNDHFNYFVLCRNCIRFLLRALGDNFAATHSKRVAIESDVLRRARITGARTDRNCSCWAYC